MACPQRQRTKTNACWVLSETLFYSIPVVGFMANLGAGDILSKLSCGRCVVRLKLARHNQISILLVEVDSAIILTLVRGNVAADRLANLGLHMVLGLQLP